jgi:hypothetical protein
MRPKITLCSVKHSFSCKHIFIYSPKFYNSRKQKSYLKPIIVIVNRKIRFLSPNKLMHYFHTFLLTKKFFISNLDLFTNC